MSVFFNPPKGRVQAGLSQSKVSKTLSANFFDRNRIVYDDTGDDDDDDDDDAKRDVDLECGNENYITNRREIKELTAFFQTDNVLEDETVYAQSESEEMMTLKSVEVSGRSSALNNNFKIPNGRQSDKRLVTMRNDGKVNDLDDERNGKRRTADEKNENIDIDIEKYQKKKKKKEADKEDEVTVAEKENVKEADETNNQMTSKKRYQRLFIKTFDHNPPTPSPVVGTNKLLKDVNVTKKRFIDQHEPIQPPALILPSALNLQQCNDNGHGVQEISRMPSAASMPQPQSHKLAPTSSLESTPAAIQVTKRTPIPQQQFNSGSEAPLPMRQANSGTSTHVIHKPHPSHDDFQKSMNKIEGCVQRLAKSREDQISLIGDSAFRIKLASAKCLTCDVYPQLTPSFLDMYGRLDKLRLTLTTAKNTFVNASTLPTALSP